MKLKAIFSSGLKQLRCDTEKAKEKIREQEEMLSRKLISDVVGEERRLSRGKWRY